MIQTIKNLLTPKLFLFLAIGWSLLILVGSLISFNIQENIEYNLSDKILHAAAYFILTGLWLQSFQKKISKITRGYFIISLLIVVYGIIIEVLQEILTQNREADEIDVLANIAGVLLALAVVVLSKKVKLNKYFSK